MLDTVERLVGLPQYDDAGLSHADRSRIMGGTGADVHRCPWKLEDAGVKDAVRAEAAALAALLTGA